YREFSDLTAVDNADAAIEARATARGLSVTITPLDDYQLLDPAMLAGKHVLLLYAMPIAADPAAIGAAWHDFVQDFVMGGGIVVVLNNGDPSYQVLRDTGLLRLDGPGVPS